MNATNPPLPEIPQLEIDNGEPVADSRDIAKRLGRELKHVHQAIRDLDMSLIFIGRNFRPNEINDLRGTHISHYLVTEPGFIALCRSFTGGVAAEIFEAFVNEFYRMREELRRRTPAIAAPSSMLEAIELAAAGWRAEKNRADALALTVVEVTAERDAKSHAVDLANTVYKITSPSVEGKSLEDVQKLFGVDYIIFFRSLRTLKVVKSDTKKIIPMEYYMRSDQKGKWFECVNINGYLCTRILPLGVAGLAILYIEAGIIPIEPDGFIERMEETIRSIDISAIGDQERKHIAKAKRQLDEIKAKATQPMFPDMFPGA